MARPVAGPYHSDGIGEGGAGVERSTAIVLFTDLVTALVRLLAATGAGHGCTPVAALDLKGLRAPAAACEAPWEPLGEPSPPMPALLTAAGRIFVGRAEQLERLGRLWKEATSGAR